MVAVGATMLIAGVAAVVLTRAGTRRGDVRAVTVGTAFAAMAALLLIHALATPEVFLGEDRHGLLAFAGGATLPVGAAILCLAAHPRLRGPRGRSACCAALQVVTVAWILFARRDRLRRSLRSSPRQPDRAAARGDRDARSRRSGCSRCSRGAAGARSRSRAAAPTCRSCVGRRLAGARAGRGDVLAGRGASAGGAATRSRRSACSRSAFRSRSTCAATRPHTR